MIINLSRIDFGGVATGGKSKPEEVFDVQPTTTDQTITPTEGSVFSGGTVRAVTKEIDVNIVSNNIKEGVTILGVAGTLKEEKPEESFDVQPTTAEQTITPTEGSVFSGGTVKAVTSAIDNNIVAGNIKEGVTILGVAGALKGEKPEESFNVQPTTAEQTITPTEGSVFSGGTVKAVTSAIDSNIVPENIKEGVSILGVAGTLSGGSGGSSASIYDGSFDEDGLRAIGWTDDDIAYFKEANPHFADMNARYIVSEANKALYGKVTYKNINDEYGSDPNMVFVPKFDIPTSNISFPLFSNPNIIGIPSLDYSLLASVNSGSVINDSIFMSLKAYNIPPFNVPPRVKDLSDLYRNSDIIAVDLRDTQNVTNMKETFGFCRYLTAIRPMDTQNVTDMSYMFTECDNLKNIPHLDTKNVTNMNGMFRNCKSLITIPHLDTKNVTDMGEMFNYCKNLTTVPRLNMQNVTNAQNMFGNCSKLTTVPQLNMQNVTSISEMFNYCSHLITVSQLNTPKAIYMNRTFLGCDSLTTVEGIDFSGLTKNPTNLFGYSSSMPKITRFIVNGKINVNMSDNYSIKVLTAIDYDSVKSILAAADRTDNTDAKELAFNRTMTDQNGELAALVASCTTKGWTITGLTLQ